MNSTWLDNKAKAIIVTTLAGVFAPLLAAWNGSSSWHVAIGIAGGVVVANLITYFTPNAKVAPVVVAPVKRAPARRKKVV